jgi:hypothetical protein
MGVKSIIVHSPRSTVHGMRYNHPLNRTSYFVRRISYRAGELISGGYSFFNINKYNHQWKQLKPLYLKHLFL